MCLDVAGSGMKERVFVRPQLIEPQLFATGLFVVEILSESFRKSQKAPVIDITSATHWGAGRHHVTVRPQDMSMLRKASSASALRQ